MASHNGSYVSITRIVFSGKPTSTYMGRSFRIHKRPLSIYLYSFDFTVWISICWYRLVSLYSHEASIARFRSVVNGSQGAAIKKALPTLLIGAPAIRIMVVVAKQATNPSKHSATPLGHVFVDQCCNQSPYRHYITSQYHRYSYSANVLCGILYILQHCVSLKYESVAAVDLNQHDTCFKGIE